MKALGLYTHTHTPYIYEKVWNNSTCLTKQSNKQEYFAFSKPNGITLIALVVTIVVLLILAGITINLLLSDGGIFEKAEQSKIEQRKAEVLDQLYNAEAAVSVEYLGKPTIENFLEQIYKEQIVVEDDTEDLGNGAYNVYTEDGLVFEVSAIIGTNVNDIVYEYIGQAGNLPPAIRITNTTTNSVAIEVLRAEGVTEFKYSYKLHTDDSYTVAQESSNSNTYTYTGLTSNTIYDVQVEFTKDGELVTITKSVLVGEIPSGAIKLRSVTWSSGVATATIYTEEDGYQIEWQIGAIDEAGWTRVGEGIKETSVPNVQNGQIIYARLYDGVSSGKEANFDIRDEIEPQDATITPSATEITLGESLTATVTHTDNESGVDITSCKWELTASESLLGTEESSYSNNFTSNGQQLTLTPTTAGNNYLHVLTVDNAGNKKETVSSAIIVNFNAGNVDILFLDTDNNIISRVQTPDLGEGMTPIKWNESTSTWVQTTSSDPEWYNYTTSDKKWANAVVGGTFDESGNLDESATGYAMFVWIPRYAYKIEYLASDGKTVTGYSDSRGIVDLNGNVEEGTEKAGVVSVGNNYVVHPAFSYFEDNRAISGIWVAKFEASHTGCTTTASTGTSGTNTTTLTLQVKPGVTSWRSITIGNMFTVCQNYNTSLNSHLIKNSEWGAVAYLAQSEYGKNGEIWINNSSSYITGSVGNGTSAEQDIETTNDYTSAQGQEASTTGTIYGIYDMSGGAWERVAAYVNNGILNNRSAIVSAPSYMKDVYDMASGDSRQANYEANSDVYGDAVYETSSSANSDNGSWYGDNAYFPYSSASCFTRGGGYSYGSRVGVFYFAGNGGGETSSLYGFRPTLIIQ